MRKIYFNLTTIALAFYLTNVYAAVDCEKTPNLPFCQREPVDPTPTKTCSTTIMITQEDGRTAYASGQMVLSASGDRFDGRMDTQFSDREINIPSNGSSVRYDQNFNKYPGTTSHPSGATDETKFVFKQIATNQFQLNLLLVRWGAQFNVALTKASQAELYIGWGPTIGNVSGSALYTFSINKCLE